MTGPATRPYVVVAIATTAAGVALLGLLYAPTPSTRDGSTSPPPSTSPAATPADRGPVVWILTATPSPPRREPSPAPPASEPSPSRTPHPTASPSRSPAPSASPSPCAAPTLPVLGCPIPRRP